MSDFLAIPLSGLTAGKSDFSWRLGMEFIGSFGNSEILDADVSVQAWAEKAGGNVVHVDGSIDGSLCVACDRCLSPLKLPVARGFSLCVKSGPEPQGGDPYSENGREVLRLPTDTVLLDLAQVVYDYICLSIPLKHVHEDGSCDPAVTSHLSGDEDAFAANADCSPFAALKGLFGREQMIEK